MAIPTDSPSDLSQQAQAAYQNGDFAQAVKLFQAAAALYRANDPAAAAEMDNNASVALLKTGDAAGALQLCAGTERIFADLGDLRRQAMSLGNQAAAQEALGHNREAIDLYTRSAELLKDSGERELRAYVLSSLSALQVKTGKRFEAMASMQAALEARQNLTLKEKFLKQLLKIPFRMMGKS